MEGLKINATAKDHEIICAKLLKKYVFQKQSLIVGDNGGAFLPDIYSEDKTLGVEVVQMEKHVDLDMKYVGKAKEKYKSDFLSVQKFCDEHYPNQYILTERDGKVESITGSGRSHMIDWMQDIYSHLCDKKLNKLNQGNYKSINGEMGLCVSILARRKRDYDALLLTYEYFLCRQKFQCSYDKLFIITTDSIFCIYPFQMKSISPIIRQNSIVDFNVEGVDYMEDIPIDYNSVL